MAKGQIESAECLQWEYGLLCQKSISVFGVYSEFVVTHTPALFTMPDQLQATLHVCEGCLSALWQVFCVIGPSLCCVMVKLEVSDVLTCSMTH